MKHLGDITQLKGAEVPTVNVVIGGSPCQDLSIAGKREGMGRKCPKCGVTVSGKYDVSLCPVCGSEMEYTRSGLFMEQIRVIKEMRKSDEQNGRTGTDVRPRFMVWENVPGAFSSNKGQDFAAVIEESVRVAEPQAPAVHVPAKGWPTSGCFYDVDGRWSVAWRVFDAQFWGVPQRRRRIALVADFGGLTAPEILFERESLHGYYHPCGSPWQTPAPDSAGGPVSAGGGRAYCLQGNGIGRSDNVGCNGKGWTEDQCYTLNTVDRPAVVNIPITDVASTLRAGAGAPKHDADIRGRLVLGVVENQQSELRLHDRCNALTSGGGKPGQGFPCVLQSLTQEATGME